jgi:hypothetical protein
MGIIHASYSLDKIRDHWNEYRCNPLYMPFAGAIRPDVSTQENFLYCINTLGNEVIKYPLDVIHMLLGTVVSALSEMTAPLGVFRNMFSRLRKFILSFTASTMSKATTSSSVFIHYLIKLRDLFKRFVGEGYIASLLTYTLFSFAESFVILFISIVKTFVFAMLAIAVVLALFQPELFAIVLVLTSILASSGA